VGIAAVILCATFALGANQAVTTDSTAVGATRAAASDSTKPILLPPVVVSGTRTPAVSVDAGWIPSSARAVYPDDGSKQLLGDLRITSALPASAELSLHGLPMDQTAREYIWGHRIGGPTTAVFGSRTKVNPDVLQVVLHPFLMSHQYRDTNGSLELRPTFESAHAPALAMSSDAIERRATVWAARGSTPSTTQFRWVSSVRQNYVVPLLRELVPALRVVPHYLDSQTYAGVRAGDQTFEGFLLLGHERGDWREMIDGVEGAVLDDSWQNLAVVRYQRELPHDSKLTAGMSWEGDHVDSERRYANYHERTKNTSHILNPRIAYSTRREACTVWLSRFCVESVPGGSYWRAGLDGGVEGRATAGWFTVEPSLSFQQFGQEATILHGATAIVHPDEWTLTAGYGTYADYFVFQRGIFANVFDPGGAQQPQRAQHYVASVQYEPKRKWPFDVLRATALRKDLDVDLWSVGRRDVQVLSWDVLIARGGDPSWELAWLVNDARSEDGPIEGMIPVSARAGVSGRVRSLSVSIEANYRSGAYASYRTPGPHFGERFKLRPSTYVNLALTQRFWILNRPADLTATIFNALAAVGGRAELTVDQYGRSYDAPAWGNLRLRYEVW
jgi:hypothetical protein